MECHSDVILFDGTPNLQKGGVAYRDWCETNCRAWRGCNGIGLWSAGGQATGLNLAVVGDHTLLAWWFRDVSLRWRFGLAAALLVFYVGSSEWCHVQRDPWMLLPALAAMELRRRSLDRPSFMRSVCEGMLWAAAFWIKPFVAVPGFLVWLASARLARTERRALVGSIVFDVLGVLAGGVVVGAAGIAWMVASGAWPHFVAMATDWNREYFDYDVTEGRPLRIVTGFLSRSFPWVLIHLVAIPVAVRQLTALAATHSPTLLAALCLGWFRARP